MAYSFTTAVAGLKKLEVFKKKEDFPKGITAKVDAFVQGVIKSFPYWANKDKATFKTMVAVIDDTHPALFDRLRRDLKVLVGVVTLKDVVKSTKNPDIFAELVRLSKGIESLREELAKAFASKAKEIETPKPKAKKAKAVVEEELFPL
jgi:hypothetical protein